VDISARDERLGEVVYGNSSDRYSINEINREISPIGVIDPIRSWKVSIEALTTSVN
jgi:hypothetical protein